MQNKFYTITLIFALAAISLKAQAPQALNYQAVARAADGKPLANGSIQVRFSIHDQSPAGNILYQETHIDTTNQFGLFTTQIGNGTVVQGSFSGIDWGSGPKFLQVEMDASGGTNFIDMGTTQLLSVPYALYAEKSGSASNSSWSLIGNTGTDPSKNFIGTTDNNPLVFKVNNIFSGEIDNLKSNTFLGYKSGENSSGNWNTAIGDSALLTNTSGYNNIAAGSFALFSNTSGNSNSAVGNAALFLNNNGSGNTTIGDHSLYSNTIGNYNVANGVASLERNGSGDNNTAMGYYSMPNNTTGSMNTSSGYESLFSNTSGISNTALGEESLYFNSTANSNTAVGSSSLFNCAASNGNTAIGANSAFKTTGGFNTAVGSTALYNNISGSDNTAVGDGADMNADNFTNAGAFGFAAVVDASNHILIGNSLITWIGGAVNWSVPSDERFKKNIHQDVHGLDFIMKLQPITYNLDMEKLNDFIYGNKMNNLAKDVSWQKSAEEKESIRYSGFSAQQVEQAANDVGYDFSGIGKPQNAQNHYTLSYADFVVPLVKAVQEQQNMIEELKTEIELLKKQIQK